MYSLDGSFRAPVCSARGTLRVKCVFTYTISSVGTSEKCRSIECLSNCYLPHSSALVMSITPAPFGHTESAKPAHRALCFIVAKHCVH